MKYKLVIFDLDGTLLNTLGDLTDGVNYAMRYLQMPERSLQEVLSFIGNGNRVLMERSVRPGSDAAAIQVAIDKFHEYYSRHYADQTVAYPGIPELLQQLRSAGYRLAVVSNKADYAVQDLCRKYFGGIFDFVIGDREGIRRKPAADPVNLAIETLGAAKAETIYIGDSEVDIQTAANAGLPCILVDWGFRGRDVLIAAGAEVIISDPAQLPALL